MLEESRASLTSGNTDERIRSLLQERKSLEQRLEEAHLHLSDIKSSWSGQNLALETQVNRLSRQVAEETRERHNALKLKDDLIEKVKQLEFELEKTRNEVTQRDNKVRKVGPRFRHVILTIFAAFQDYPNERRNRRAELRTEGSSGAA